MDTIKCESTDILQVHDQYARTKIVNNKMKIDNLVEQGYEIFSAYKISSTLDVCKVCCITDQEEQMLIRTPLRKLNEDILGTYINSARCSSDREQYEMRYFLPRILELISQDIFATICADTLFDRLFGDDLYYYSGAKKEYDFLNEFFLEYWIHYLTSPDMKSEPLESIIVMLGRHFNIEPMLRFWLKTKSKQATLYFAELIIYLDRYATLGMFATDELNQNVSNWLKDNNTRKIFTERFEDLYLNDKLNDEDNLTVESAYVLYTNNFV